MSNKNLLSDNTVRRFMKLATIEPLTDSFVSKTQERIAEMSYVADDEDPMAEEEVELDMGPGAPDEDPMADAEMDAPEDLADEAPAGDADISLTEEEARVLNELGERLSEAMASAEPEMDAEEPEPELEMDDVAPEEPAPEGAAGPPAP